MDFQKQKTETTSQILDTLKSNV